jgi:Putative zinc-finger
MNDRTSCATPEALVTYLYEECEPAERESIAAHVAMCASCAEEIQALGDTRAHLASWSPPALPLGFQITRSESDQPAKVLRPAAWYRQPLPAWAQMAAAVLIFAAGMSVSAFRSSGEQPARVVEAPTTQAGVAADKGGDDLGVTRAEFARVEARLRAMESADVSRASYVQSTDGAVDANDLAARFRSLENYVLNKQIENSETLSKVTQALNSNRRDIDAIRETTQKINVMDEELQGHRQVLLNPGLLMRTALTSSGR